MSEQKWHVSFNGVEQAETFDDAASAHAHASTLRGTWFVGINGVEEEETFDDEEKANAHAAKRRGHRIDNGNETKAPDLNKKIAVYQKDTKRHMKAVAAGAAPKPASPPNPNKKKTAVYLKETATDASPPPPAPSSPTDPEKKSEEPPAKGDAKKK